MWKKFNMAKFINYTSDVIMLLFVLIFFGAVVFTGIVVWNEPSEVSSFVELVKDVVMLAVGGYWGRIALTHYQTLKGGNTVTKDFLSEDDLEYKGTVESEVYEDDNEDD